MQQLKRINTKMCRQRISILFNQIYIYIYIYIYTRTHTEGAMGKLLLFQIINFVHMFCLLCSKLELVWYCLWRKLHHDSIDCSKNLEMACCIAWHSHRNLHFKDYRVFGCYNLRTNSSWWKPNTQSTSWCLGWSLAMVMLCLYLFSCITASSLTWRPTSNGWRR